MSNDKEFSRDYDISEINKEEKDPRFMVAAREGILTQVVYFIIVSLGIAVAYALAPSDPEKVTYVFNTFPTWLFAGVVIYLIGTIGLLVYFVKTKIFSFEPRA